MVLRASATDRTVVIYAYTTVEDFGAIALQIRGGQQYAFQMGLGVTWRFLR